jgi:SAM-dependent methyltransferase
MTWNLENSFDRTAYSVNPPSWPNEMLVKIMSSTHYANLASEISHNSKILEVGIFSGNNTRFLLENGYKVHGSEINQDMIELCINNLSRLQYKVPDIRIGNNTNLQFEDNEFDLLVSINTIHYSPQQDSRKGISEFARVVRANGWAIIETPARNHFAVQQAERHGELDWEWKAGGFRQGEKFGFFDSEEHFKNALLEEFSEVTICYRMEKYREITLDFWMAICKK